MRKVKKYAFKSAKQEGKERMSVKDKVEIAGIIGGLILVALDITRFILDYIVK
jgi:hypothetical protein